MSHPARPLLRASLTHTPTPPHPHTPTPPHPHTPTPHNNATRPAHKNGTHAHAHTAHGGAPR
jgi:hypothetical protein